MIRTLFLWALLCAVAVSTASAEDSCGWNGYDFSSLTSVDLRAHDFAFDYYLHVCGPMTSEVPLCNQLGAGVSACQLRPGYQAFHLGEWPEDGAVQWSYIDPRDKYAGVQYEMVGGMDCKDDDWKPTNCTSLVQFVCARSLGSLSVEHAKSRKIFRLPTPLACPSVDPEPAVAGCQWNGYDFSALAGHDIKGSDGGFIYDYYLRVCGELDQAGCSAAAGGTAACQRQVNPPGPVFSIGQWPHAGQGVEWSYLDPQFPSRGVQYQLVGSPNCWATGAPTPYHAAIKLQCAREQAPLVKVEQFACFLNFTLPTPLACPESLLGSELETRLALE